MTMIGSGQASGTQAGGSARGTQPTGLHMRTSFSLAQTLSAMLSSSPVRTVWPRRPKQPEVSSRRDPPLWRCEILPRVDRDAKTSEEHLELWLRPH